MSNELRRGELMELCRSLAGNDQPRKEDHRSIAREKGEPGTRAERNTRQTKESRRTRLTERQKEEENKSLHEYRNSYEIGMELTK